MVHTDTPIYLLVYMCGLSVFRMELCMHVFGGRIHERARYGIEGHPFDFQNILSVHIKWISGMQPSVCNCMYGTAWHGVAWHDTT